jgi:hypothetical protein
VLNPGLFCFNGSHWVGGSSLGSPGNQVSVPSNVFPNKWGRVLEVAFSGGTPSKYGLLVPIESMSSCLNFALGKPL